jgi:hypothetical protein
VHLPRKSYLKSLIFFLPTVNVYKVKNFFGKKIFLENMYLQWDFSIASQPKSYGRKKKVFTTFKTHNFISNVAFIAIDDIPNRTTLTSRDVDYL